MSFEEFLDVQEAGSFSVVRFRGEITDIGNEVDSVLEALRRFASTHGCLKIAFDVAREVFLPSSVLGLLVRLHTQEGVEVHLVNASEAVVDIINVTHLNRMLHVNEVEIGEWDAPSADAGQAIAAIPLGGYFVDCPSCGEEHRVSKHDLGIRLTCDKCRAKHTVSAEMLHDATDVYAECAACRQEMRIPHEELRMVLTCEHCETNLEIRTVV